MFCPEITMSHLPAFTAAMIVSNTEFTHWTFNPRRAAISMPVSISEPTRLPFAS